MNNDQKEIKSRLVAAGKLTERNYFSLPYVAESKQVFIDYCKDALGIDAKSVGKIVKARFGGEVKTWDNLTALGALQAIYENFLGELNPRLSVNHWATPNLCPLCGNEVMETQPGQGLCNIISKPYHSAWCCYQNGKIIATDHFTWPVLQRVVQRSKK